MNNLRKEVHSTDVADSALKSVFIFYCHWSSEVFLSSGDVQSQQSLSDNMAAGLPLLSDCIQPDVFSLALPVPGPLEIRGRLVSRERRGKIQMSLGARGLDSVLFAAAGAAAVSMEEFFSQRGVAPSACLGCP